MGCQAKAKEQGLPMPIGPKCPLNNASRKLLISGIHLNNATMIGRRRNNNTRMARQMSRPTESDRASSENESKGIHAPTNTNAAVLRSRSMTEENTEASVCLLKKPSQAKAVPHANDARRSSEPIRLVVPTVRSARDTYCATYDCRSMRSLRSQNFMRCRKPNPRMEPHITLSTIWSVQDTLIDVDGRGNWVCTEPQGEEPIFDRLSSCAVEREIEREVQKRVRCAIVTTRLGSKQMP